jgi:hypothetical protein
LWTHDEQVDLLPASPGALEGTLARLDGEARGRATVASFLDSRALDDPAVSRVEAGFVVGVGDDRVG